MANDYKLVYVKWADAHGSGGEWEPIENAEATRLVVHTCGWLYAQTETEISLLQSACFDKESEDAFYNRMCIPKGMIVSMRTIGKLEDE